MTRPAARIFQRGKGSFKKKAEAPIPKMGTNNGAGATSAAGCFESNQPHAAYPKSVLPQDCQSTPNQPQIEAEATALAIPSPPPSKIQEIKNSGGIEKALAQIT